MRRGTRTGGLVTVRILLFSVPKALGFFAWMDVRLAPKIWAVHRDHFTSLDRLSGFQQLGKDRLVRGDFIAGNTRQHNPQLELFQVLLLPQFAVDGDEDIKVVLRVGQQRAVFTAAPTNLGDRLYRVAWKCRLHSWIDPDDLVQKRLLFCSHFKLTVFGLGVQLSLFALRDHGR